MLKSRAVLVATAVVALIVLAAGAAQSARSAGSTIKLMVIAPVGTPIQDVPDAPAGAQAAAAAINKAGGVNGHQLEVEFCNTQSQINAATACARQAVSDGVAAVVGHISTLSTVEIPILQQGGIPDIGVYSVGNIVDYTNPDVYPIVGGNIWPTMAAPFALKKIGKKRLFLIYQDVASSATQAKRVVVAAKAAGISLVGSFVLPGATTDFAPYAEKLRQANPDSVFMSTAAGPAGGIMRTSVSLGITPLWVLNSAVIGEAEAAQIGAPAQGMMLGSAFPSVRDNVPGMKKFLAEMTAANFNDPKYLKVTGINAWLSVHAFAAIAKQIKGTIDAAAVTKALRAQKKPINLYDLASWTPGARGIAAYPRWTTAKAFFLKVNPSYQLYSWGAPIVSMDPLALQHFVR